MKKLHLMISLFGMVILLATSCSEEDKLVGRWSYTFGLGNRYTENRMFSESGPGNTFFHTLVFEKGEGKEGKFTDTIYPLVLGTSSDQKMLVGSKITGEWTIKNHKLYLQYNDDMQLLNADALYDVEKSQIAEVWNNRFENWKKKGEEGYTYEIVEKNGKIGLKIPDLQTPAFIKEQDKE